MSQKKINNYHKLPIEAKNKTKYDFLSTLFQDERNKMKELNNRLMIEFDKRKNESSMKKT